MEYKNVYILRREERVKDINLLELTMNNKPIIIKDEE